MAVAGPILKLPVATCATPTVPRDQAAQANRARKRIAFVGPPGRKTLPAASKCLPRHSCGSRASARSPRLTAGSPWRQHHSGTVRRDEH